MQSCFLKSLNWFFVVLELISKFCFENGIQLSSKVWRDPYPVQYLGYCTVCNTSNPSHPFNPMAPYLDTSPVQASNPYALLFSTEFLSHSPSAPLSQPRLRLHHSLKIHACSLPLPQPRRHHFLHTQLRPINKNKEKMASEIPTPKHAHPF